MRPQLVEDDIAQIMSIDERLSRLEQVSVPATPIAIVSFQNSWVNYDTDRPARYWKIGNTVFLTGIIKNGTVGSTAFTLSAEFAPLSVNALIFPAVSNTAFGTLAVYSTGAVVPNTGSNIYFSLDGVAFPVN